jgi:predicted Zn-dependent protease
MEARQSRMGSRGDARGIERLHPAMRSRMWKPGQSGNPTGHSGEYGVALKLAQRAAPKAVRRLIELIDSLDERVAAVACNSILDRAFGKSKPAEEAKDDLVSRVEAMSPEERVWMAQELLERAKRYVPAFGEALAKSQSLRLAFGGERSDGED